MRQIISSIDNAVGKINRRLRSRSQIREHLWFEKCANVERPKDTGRSRTPPRSRRTSVALDRNTVTPEIETPSIQTQDLVTATAQTVVVPPEEPQRRGRAPGPLLRNLEDQIDAVTAGSGNRNVTEREGRRRKPRGSSVTSRSARRANS